jgi:carbamoyl-phosphate synthase large subunit
MDGKGALFSTILVTGCGGDIALGLGGILKQTGLAERIIGCDIHGDHAGCAVFDDCYIVKRADDSHFLETMESLVNQETVDLVIPVAEPELRYLVTADKLNDIGGKPLVTANRRALEIGFDKLRTAEFIEELGFASPWTKIVDQGLPPEIPCIVKNRSGSGSREVRVIDDIMLAEYYIKYFPGFIWQEYLEPSDEEYTCGLYQSRRKEIRTTIMKRKLMGGLTGQGIVVEDRQIEELLHRIAEFLELEGSINVQLRKTERGPVVFEINPRFSSTIVFRHKMGFQDVLWSIQECAGMELESYTPPVSGTRFYRLAEEFFIPPGADLSD